MGKILNDILLILFGISSCSIISSFISFQLGFPFGVPELICFLFLPFFKKDFIFFLNYSKRNILEVILVFLILSTLSLLMASNNTLESLSSGRSILLLMLFFSYGINVSLINTRKLFLISFGAVLGSFINSYLNYGEIGAYTFNNSLAFALFVIYPLIKKKSLLFVLCVVLAIGIAVLSGLRRQILEIFIVLFFTLVGVIYRDKHKILAKVIISISLLTLIIYATLPIIKDYFKRTSYYIYSKIFIRTQETIEQGVSSEGTRARHIPNFLEYMADTIIPKGFYPRNISFRVGNSGGATFDFPLYEIFYTIGSITTLFLIIYIVKKILLVYINIRKEPQKNFYAIFYTAPCIMVIFSTLFDGGFMQHNFITPFTGLVFGLLLRKKKAFLK